MSAPLDDLAAGRTIDIGGVATHYHDAGEGPPLLLIHGSGPGVSAWANWRLVMPILAKSFRVLAYDQLGFNKTIPANGGFGRERWTRHGLAFADAMGLDKFDVIGNSMGGSIAFSMAATVPGRIGRILNMGTLGVPSLIPPGLDEVWAYTPSEANMKRAIELLAYDQRINTPDLVRLRLEASQDPAADAAWRAMFPAPRQRWHDDLSLSWDELAAITQQVLLVHGYNDQVVPFAKTSLVLMDVLQDVRMHVFANTGHWVQIERTSEFCRLAESFFTAA
ncbi:MAG: alpha/beta hydrolase [Phenylobacterium sp.]|uniref:alpha/beta fold hydrolase n=1 Tax=Phenylobacterium sp. TaxID=1871053 RepID=UPI0027364141|nr:alpha/beta hydrolase [Phenylobacterium sp.]MDP3173339.1 alpha/beta hydrolase [Phenylobacterium sp.]